MRRTLLTLLTVVGATPVAAQTPPPGAPMPPGAMLMRADADGDGRITRAEALAAADARFERLDTDHDGMVTPEEMRAGRPPMRGGPGAPPPPSGTGAPPPPTEPMTRDESRTRALQAFDRADRNHDGVIDRDELAAMRPMRGPGVESRPGGPAGDAPPPPPQD